MTPEQQTLTTPPDQPGRWTLSDEANEVEADPELIADIRRAAIEAFLAIPRRGMEIGGLLLGRLHREPGTRTRFVLSGFEEIPCEHASGPSYLLSKRDRERLAERLGERGAEGSSSVVGLYRSYTGREAEPDAADQEVIRAFFPNRQLVCLLLQPLSVDKCPVTVRFSGVAGLLAETSEKSVPPPPAALSPEGPAPEPHPAFAREIPWHQRYREEARRPARIPDLRRFGMAAAFCVLFGIAAGSLWELHERNAEPRWAPVHFDARVYEGDMILNWDPGIPAVTQATRGVLLVNDGRTPRTIQLSPEVLHRGNLKYTPESADVLFRLRLYNEGTLAVTDSLRVIAPRRAVSTMAAQAVADKVPEPATPKASVEKPAPAGSVTVRREVQPEIPAGIRNRITAPIEIQVIVGIDESGRVIRAFSKTPGHGLDRYLADEAVKAARQWLFSPSRSGSSKVLNFAFTPAAQQ